MFVWSELVERGGLEELGSDDKAHAELSVMTSEYTSRIFNNSLETLLLHLLRRF